MLRRNNLKVLIQLCKVKKEHNKSYIKRHEFKLVKQNRNYIVIFIIREMWKKICKKLYKRDNNRLKLWNQKYMILK